MTARWIAAAMAMLGSAATAQTSAWAYFESEGGLLQAGVQTANGEQLIFKCDERGDGKVVAVIYTPARLKPPAARPQPRPVRMRFDAGATQVESWPYYEQTVMALNTRRERQLPPFLTNIADAHAFEVVLDPVDGSPIEITFQVTGAREAIARVYESCGDSTNPLAAAP